MKFLLKKKKYLLFLFEISLILILTIFSTIQSEKFLRSWHGPGGSITTDLYIPSIMFACGKGFTNVNPSEVPHLRAFLDFNEQSFSADYIPENIQRLELDIYQQYHRYLIYTLGIVWRLFGVSWEVVRWFLVILYTITIVIVYGIARVFIPFYLSIFIGYYFIKSEVTMVILQILRDFARAPFILLVLLILFHLIRGKKTNWQFVLLSVLLGLTCGIGMGFRRDLLLYFVLSLFILCIVPRKNDVPKFLVRIICIVVTIIVFLISSYPILQAFHQFGTLGWHDTLMGFGIDHDDFAGLQRTNYERIPRYDDLLVSACADVHSYYHEPFTAYELNIKKNPELEKRKLFFAYIYWFPADILIRTYSAITRISDHILTSALPINLYRALLSLAIIVLFMAIDFQRGLCFALILLYAMGIQTLQFHFRHNFYLAFVPYLLYFLLLHWIIAGTYSLWKGGKEKIRENWDNLINFVKKFTIVAFTIAFFSLGVLMVTRQVQSYQISKLLQAYHTSDIVPISYKTYTTDRGTVYSLDKPLSSRLEDFFPADCSFTTNILVVDFVVNQFPACFETIYDGVNNFSCNLTITRSTHSEDNHVYVRYFLPVYENMRDLKTDWNRFVGIRVEDTDKLQVQGMYKICNLDKIPLFINYYFIKDEVPVLYQRIAPYSENHINPCWKPWGLSPSQAIKNEAMRTFYGGDTTKAFELLQKAMEDNPYSLEYGLTLAELYEQTGEIEKTKETYIRIISNRPHDPIPGIKLETLLSQKNFSPEEKQKFWEDLTKQLPDSSIAWLYHAKNQVDTTIAKESLKKAVNLNKDILLSTPFTSVFYDWREIFSQTMRNTNNADSSICSNISIRKQISYMLTAGMYLSERKDYQRALDILQFLTDIAPDYHLIYPPLVSTLLKLQDANIETIFYYSTTLISLTPYELEPITQIEDIHNNIHYFSPQEWLEIWKDLENKFPDSPCILCGLGRAYELSQQKTEAEQIYKKATQYARKSDECTQLAYYRLAKLMYLSGQIDNAISLLKKAIRLYPDNSILQTLLEEYN